MSSVASGSEIFSRQACSRPCRRAWYSGYLATTLVDDISDEARVAIDLVGDDLSAAVGKSNAVRASGNLAIIRLLVAEVVVRGGIIDGVGQLRINQESYPLHHFVVTILISIYGLSKKRKNISDI